MTATSPDLRRALVRVIPPLAIGVFVNAGLAAATRIVPVHRVEDVCLVLTAEPASLVPFDKVAVPRRPNGS